MRERPVELEWRWHRFSTLSPELLYRLMAERQAVFVVEQACPYLDADGLDLSAWHLICLARTGSAGEWPIAGYLRVVAPGDRYAEPAIGRVLTTGAYRGMGIGRQLIGEGIRGVERFYPGSDIRLSAQAHLAGFYAEQGFRVVSAPYDEDGIPHVEMVRLNPL